ncbi:MAG: DUF4810 domain-containing protein [Prevotellaceae bacterium]|jgi:hypothetical protein|nr:DUF4810 domain-containing protein [Prevotellaceae bacterium]
MKTMSVTICAALCLASSCSTQKPLYSWDKYNNASYSYLKNSDEAALQELIKTYQKIIAKQTGSRGVVPPGIYADYGFLLLQADKISEGKAMLLKELELYPESKVFVDRILKMFEK